MWRLLLFCLALLFGARATAHQIAEMEMTVVIEGDHVTGYVSSDAAYLIAEFRGDEDAPPQDNAWLRQLDEPAREQLKIEGEKYLRDCLHLLADDRDLVWKLSYPDFEGDPPPYLTKGEPEDVPIITLKIETDFPKGAQLLQLSWQEPLGVVLILHTNQGEGRIDTTPLVSGETTLLAQREETIAGESEIKIEKPSRPSFLSWIRLGFLHILPEGIDHILFVFGLFLLAPKWRPLLQQTITFTIAHSISLAAAALHLVDFSSETRRNAVEILVALSIVWVGVENLWIKELGRGRLIVVGLFGLVHGLGFAGTLANLLPVGQPDDLPPALLGFNLGVEFAQIAIILISFAAFGWLGERFGQVKRIGSIAIALAGAALVISHFR